MMDGCRLDFNASDDFVYPAEWEPHDAVWISFFGGPTDGISYDMVASVARDTPVKVVVPKVDFYGNSAGSLNYVVRARFREMGINQANIEIITSDSLVQTRDTGPIFLKNTNGELRIVDFLWNNYGESGAFGKPYRDSYPFDSLMAVQKGIPFIKSTIALEGGAIEVNGDGVLLQVEAVTLQRNPGMSKAMIEAELKRVLGQQRVIWLKEGLAEDPLGPTLITDNYMGSGVGGHVDAFSRFVDPHTILLAFPDSAEAAADPVKKITLDRMKVNYDILRNEKDQHGHSFTIIKVPVPDIPYSSFVVDTTQIPTSLYSFVKNNPSIEQGDTLNWVPVASYLNFFITNNVVLLPQYWRPGMPDSVKEEDEIIRGIMARFFPDREIVPIDPLILNDAGGGIHCWTQQQPAIP